MRKPLSRGSVTDRRTRRTLDVKRVDEAYFEGDV